MNKIITESERLLLRQFTLSDTDFIIELVNSEGWIKYIGDRNIKTSAQAIEYLNNGPIKSYRSNGFGLGMVELKHDATPVGMCGLIKRDYLPNPDIGFAFLPQHCGRGYGYEIASSTLQYGFREFMPEKILAITLPTNYISKKLLEKLGLKCKEKYISKDTNEELLLYAISNPLYTTRE